VKRASPARIRIGIASRFRASDPGGARLDLPVVLAAVNTLQLLNSASQRTWLADGKTRPAPLMQSASTGFAPADNAKLTITDR